MTRRRDWTGIVLTVLLVAAAAESHAASPIDLRADGWHRWEVPAGQWGATACCYSWQHGGRGKAGCRLGGGDGFTADTECEVDADMLQVFVEVRGGKIREIQSLSAACPVEVSEPVQDHGTLGTADSINWLAARVVVKDVRDEALIAIAMHEDGAALRKLTALIEDRTQAKEIRKQALFWLVQSPDEAAYQYLDRLLGRR